MPLPQPLSSKSVYLFNAIQSCTKILAPPFIFGLPFLLSLFTYLPLGPIGFEIGKIILFQILMIILISGYLTHRILSRRRNPHQQSDNINNLLWLGWFSSLFLSSIINHRLTVALTGEQFYQFGLITLFFLWVYSWLIHQSSIKELVPTMATMGIVTGIIHACLVTVQSSFNSLSRPISSLGEPNWLGSIMTVSILIGIWTLVEYRFHRYRLLLVTSLFFLGMILLLTQSRSAIASLTISSGVFLILKRFRLPPLKACLIIVSSLLLSFSLIASIGLFPDQTFRQTEQLSFRGIQGTDSRIWIYEKGFKLWLEKPVFGWGWEAIGHAYSRPMIDTKPGINDLTIVRSHNLFLDLLISTGIVGLGFFLCLIGYSLYNLLKNYYLSKNNLWLLLSCLLLSILLYAQLNPLSLTHWVFLSLLIGLRPLEKN